MKIYNKGRGIHDREIHGINRLQTDLPSGWMAFTNLELALPYGGREIDVILVIEDRVLAVDLKDWRGKITSSGGAWSVNGNAREGGSPVEKILSNSRELYLMLQRYLKTPAARAKLNGLTTCPKVDGCVVLTGTNDRSGIALTEINRVFCLDAFIKALQDPKQRVAMLAGVPAAFHSKDLTTDPWRNLWQQFFNVKEGYFKPSSRRYGSFQALSDAYTFEHPKQIYREYDVADNAAGGATGLLRRWDFTKAETRFQNEEGRREIAGREREIIAWLNDRNAEFETSILQPRTDDDEKGIEYWEVFDRRKRLQRLLDLSRNQIFEFPRETRIELVRQIVHRAALMHRLNASHLDIGAHSVWIEPPSLVRLSHLMSASFQDVKSLGSHRYQFLSTVRLPEDAFGLDVDSRTKDVFLLGCVAHRLLFACPPVATADNPPEWDASVDKDDAFGTLHNWFERSLAWSADDRYADASTMLEAFNLALESKPSAAEVLKGLERFRTISSQMKLVREYPVVEDIRDDANIAMWRSVSEGKPVLVKMWKREGWGDQTREAPRLLGFLEQAESMIIERPAGCAGILRAIWLGDAVVLIQDFVDSPNLAQSMSTSDLPWTEAEFGLAFLRSFIATVVSLHEKKIAHGDIKPENILVIAEESPRPLLVDLLDFVHVDDGEKMSRAYAPMTGGRFERDCYAATCIVEEVVARANMAAGGLARLNEAIVKIRTESPKNGTLLPLAEALDFILDTTTDNAVREIALRVCATDTRPFLSDEGSLAFRVTPGGRQLRIRGAVEQLIFQLDGRRQAVSVRRESIDQKQITSIARWEFAAIAAELTLVAADRDDFSDLENVLSDKDIAEAWDAAYGLALNTEADRQTSAGDDVSEDAEPPSEVSADELEEKISSQSESGQLDVQALWRHLIDSEAEFVIEGEATGPSAYKPQTQRHIVPFDLDSGTFEFGREDTVTVCRLDKGGRWTRIGQLDLITSTANLLEIDVRKWGGKTGEGLVADGQRLKFESHFEITSRSRRRDATMRLLSREARYPDLIDVFDKRSADSVARRPVAAEPSDLAARYGLNKVQAEALSKLLETRPVGLLQGPPGTGKTRFIGALVHFALTQGLARNVLVASQSHEAVNGAAEAVVKLFHEAGETPSLLRVGHESNVSDRLLAYHTGKVEGLFKDRFRADQSVRLRLAGSVLGIPDNLLEQLIILETLIRPVVERLEQIQGESSDSSADPRESGLRQTLELLVGKLAHPLDIKDIVAADDLDDVALDIAGQAGFTNASKLEHFRDIANLARDFVGSVSTRERTFETFLAGTRQIVVGTCVGLGRSSLGLTSTSFDLVVVDEAARCTASELAVPLQAGRWIVLVGDHCQLEPTHRPEVVKHVAKIISTNERQVVMSDFERVFSSGYGTAAGHTLTEQYRMLSPIGSIASEAFYGGTLTHGRTDLIIPTECLPTTLHKPLAWLTTDKFGELAHQNEPDSRKYAINNPIEAELIVDLVKEWDQHTAFREWIETQTEHAHAIGIICTYRAQCELVRQKLRSAFISDGMRSTIKIDTVDSYQGKENPVVILSLVRNNCDGRVEAGANTIREGFMSRPNRLNVAVSRAMDRLVLVGAMRGWRSAGPMGQVRREFATQMNRGDAREIDGVEYRGLRETDTVQHSAASSGRSRRPVKGGAQ